MVYCTYNMLNMFRALYAHHQELETICVLLPPMVCSTLVAGCRRAAGYASRMTDVARSCNIPLPGRIEVPETC